MKLDDCFNKILFVKSDYNSINRNFFFFKLHAYLESIFETFFRIVLRFL